MISYETKPYLTFTIYAISIFFVNYSVWKVRLSVEIADTKSKMEIRSWCVSFHNTVKNIQRGEGGMYNSRPCVTYYDRTDEKRCSKVFSHLAIFSPFWFQFLPIWFQFFPIWSNFSPFGSNFSPFGSNFSPFGSNFCPLGSKFVPIWQFFPHLVPIFHSIWSSILKLGFLLK